MSNELTYQVMSAWAGILFLAMIVVPGALLPGAAKAAPAFEEIVVIGDSLSDGGNAGRFSDGPVWVEQIALALTLELRPSRAGGTNFAVGGARLDPLSGPDNLRAQADRYLAASPGGARTLHIVFGGGNDLLAAADDPRGAALARAASSLAGIVDDLAQRGATDILVPNLPDVGITPAVRSRGSRTAALARQVSTRFNAAVDEAIAGVAARPGVRIHRLDVFAMAERARADPKSFGFSDIETPCRARGGCDGHLFWDHIHPTTQAHARLARAALDLLAD